MIYDAELNQYYTPYKILDSDPFSPFLLTSAYHDFSPSELPWSEMPSYVQEIITAEPIGLVNDTSYSGDYKIPFILVFTGGSSIHVVAGYNLAIGSYYREKGTFTSVFISTIRNNPRIWKNAMCYHAYYEKDSQGSYYESTPWASVQPVAVGDNMSRYLQLSSSSPTPRDYYAYGANCIGAGKSSVGQPISGDAEYPKYFFRNDVRYGFSGDVFVYEPDEWNAYFESFVPPTPEQQQAATSKGILETLRQIPTNIADAIRSFFTGLGDRISGFFTNLADTIKGFFLPSEGFFDTYTEEFQEYFEDRFGLLYELPDSVIGILQQFISYSPAESGYSIDFPEVIMPVLDNGEWHDEVIIEETEITFDFLERGAFKTLYSMYRSVIWMIFIFALVNLIIRKGEKVFGGTSG